MELFHSWICPRSMGQEKMDDRELIEEIRKGDQLAFRQLINRHRDRLVNFCVRYLGDREEGEDTAQEICVLIYEKLDTFRGDSQFSTWLYRIAVNRCKNHHGNWWNRLFRQGKKISSVDRETSEITVIDDESSPEKQTHESELSELIMNKITGLPEKFREVILLRDMEDRTYDEIEAITGISSGTVKSRLNRGRKLLQAQLAEVRDEF